MRNKSRIASRRVPDTAEPDDAVRPGKTAEQRRVAAGCGAYATANLATPSGDRDEEARNPMKNSKKPTPIRIALAALLFCGLGASQSLAATVFVNSNITTSELWTADNEYVLTQPIYVTGSNRPLIRRPQEAMMTWYSPRDKHVWVAGDAACDTAGLCGPDGFCERGAVGDPCGIDLDCAMPANTCRMVLNYGNVPDLSFRLVKLRRDFVEELFPIYPACALKTDVQLDFSKKRRARIRLKIQGTTDGRLRRDNDVFVFHK